MPDIPVLPAAFGGAVLTAILLLWFYLKRRRVRIVVTGYGDVLEAGIMDHLIADFHAKNPGIRVAFRQFPYAEYNHEVLAPLVVGDEPDVVLMSSIHFSELSLRDFLEPLNARFAEAEMDVNAFYPQAIERFFLDGVLYALPRDVAPICLVYYNKDAFQEAGLPPPRDDWDWAEFVQAAKKLVKVGADGQVTRWGFIEAWAMVENWVFNAGGTVVDDTKKPTRWTIATDPRSRKGLEFRRDLIHKHKVMPPPSVWSGRGNFDSGELFARGEVAMILQGLWKTPRFREIKDFQWDIAMLPHNPSGKVDFSLTGSAYGIPRSSRNKDAAWKFLSYVTGPEGSRRLAGDGLAQPALETVAQSEVFLDGKDPKNKKMLLSAMKVGRYSPLCLNWPEIESVIAGEMEPAWTGEESVKECLERLKPMLENRPPRTG